MTTKCTADSLCNVALLKEVEDGLAHFGLQDQGHPKNGYDLVSRENR